MSRKKKSAIKRTRTGYKSRAKKIILIAVVSVFLITGISTTAYLFIFRDKNKVQNTGELTALLTTTPVEEIREKAVEEVAVSPMPAVPTDIPQEAGDSEWKKYEQQAKTLVANMKTEEKIEGLFAVSPIILLKANNYEGESVTVVGDATTKAYENYNVNGVIFGESNIESGDRESLKQFITSFKKLGQDCIVSIIYENDLRQLMVDESGQDTKKLEQVLAEYSLDVILTDNMSSDLNQEEYVYTLTDNSSYINPESGIEFVKVSKENIMGVIEQMKTRDRGIMLLSNDTNFSLDEACRQILNAINGGTIEESVIEGNLIDVICNILYIHHLSDVQDENTEQILQNELQENPNTIQMTNNEENTGESLGVVSKENARESAGEGSENAVNVDERAGNSSENGENE